MADRKTEGILSSEILDGFIKLEERWLFLPSSFIYIEKFLQTLNKIKFSK